MSKLDEVTAVIYGSRGGNSFAYDDEGVEEIVAMYERLGQTAYVFRKDAQ